MIMLSTVAALILSVPILEAAQPYAPRSSERSFLNVATSNSVFNRRKSNFRRNSNRGGRGVAATTCQSQKLLSALSSILLNPSFSSSSSPSQRGQLRPRLPTLVTVAAEKGENSKGWLQRLLGPTGYDRDSIVEVESAAEFKALTAENVSLAVVMASMTYCGPCKLMMPKFKLFSEAYPNANFITVVGDKNDETREILKDNRITAVPAFRVFREGKDVSEELAMMERLDVIQSERALRNVIRRNYVDKKKR